MRFLESRAIVIPQEEARNIPMLFSDSKGARLDNHKNTIHLLFFCAKAEHLQKKLVDLLLQKLSLPLQEYKTV